MAYLESKEWVIEYYEEGCKDWRWRYEYKNAPLLKDVIKRMPKGEMLEKKECNAYSSEEQLRYVIPEMKEIKEKKEEEERIKGYKRYNWE